MSDRDGTGDKDLVPQGAVPERQYRTDIDPTVLPRGQQLTWERQEAFLDAFGKYGMMTKAAQAAGSHYDTVYHWDTNNKLDFTARYKYARQEYKDHLEGMVMERLENPTGNRGSDVLLIAKVNKEDPAHWTRNVQVTHEVGREVMATLQKIQEQQQGQSQLPGGDTEEPWTVEGKGKPVEEG